MTMNVNKLVIYKKQKNPAGLLYTNIIPQQRKPCFNSIKPLFSSSLQHRTNNILIYISDQYQTYMSNDQNRKFAGGMNRDITHSQF